jgi:hypothetical protein
MISLIAGGNDLLPEIAVTLAMGERKVRDLFEWSHHLGLLVERSRNSPQRLTPLGQFLGSRESWANSSSVMEILYASLSAQHKIIGAIVNELGYSASLKFSPSFSMDEYRDFLISLTPAVVDAKPKVVLDRGSKFLNALSSSSGLGKLQIFWVNTERSQVRIQPRQPSWQAAAYILYSSWPPDTSRIRINEIVRHQNGLGRIFFLTQSQVLALLSRLERERAIALEMIADLNQIGLNPSMEAQDFLEMLPHDES